MASQFNEEDSKLIADLQHLSTKNPKLVKSNEYVAPADPNVTIQSWKMNEFKYYEVPSPFPTLARGLFTTTIEGEGVKKHRIVVRGYDKFFNIGEVPWTNWPALEARTAAPYTLTLKSNGCIIFIGTLSPTQLLVTSKHSLGQGQDAEKSHAVIGQRWLRKHLAAKGKTEEQLAATLWDRNLTAIAELCDDSFEEHVLGYPPEQTGLHLHGLNESTKHFKTLPPADVDAFANEWGFIVTKSITMNTVAEVKAFSDKAAETGSWNGEPIEGFVVRTHVVDPPHGEGKQSASPYVAGSTFFFKIKFDEPYMMYRDWREVTKKLLSAKSKGMDMDDVKMPRNKMQRPETKLYVQWVKREIIRNPGVFAEYTHGKGIIATRERFLAWMASEDGKKGVIEDTVGPTPSLQEVGKAFGKTVIVPVAIPGCGKTTVSVALAHLFGFGHTQSDDVQVKKAAPAFIGNVKNLLKIHDIVIADKNNHLRQHREQLRQVASRMNPPTRLLALNWPTEQPPAIIHRIMGDRVLARGDNHQSLRADTTDTKAHEDVIWKFITQKEELEDDEVDSIVEMSIEDTLEQAVNKAVDGCVEILSLERPTKAKVDDAIQVALEYVPTTKADDKKASKSTPRYFGLLPELDLIKVLGPQISAQGDHAFWDDLVARKAVTKRPHVTIEHIKSLTAERELWDRCMGLHRMQYPPLFKFKLGHVLWNSRIMAVTVDDIELANGVDADQSHEGSEFISKLPHDVRNRLHITVGTKENVPPFEAMTLVDAWRKGPAAMDDVGCVRLDDVDGVGRVKGLF